MSITVVIPVYKNKEQFLKNLDHNLQFLKGCEVVVVNDYPQESLSPDLTKYSQVTLIENEKNMGFGLTVNKGVHAAHNPYVMLLNTDVVLKNDSYRQGLKHFMQYQELFGVSFAQEEKNREIVGKNRFYWKNGIFYHAQADNLEEGYNGWAEGGTCILDRNKFLEIGGFDAIYKPFYWEDIDLSYRAWKAHYTILFDPHILVEHHHEGTTGKYFLKSYVELIAFRNQFLFIWKNISDKGLLAGHVLWLVPNLIYYLIKGKINFWKGFFLALGKLSEVAIKRHSQKKKYRSNDKHIFNFFKGKK